MGNHKQSHQQDKEDSNFCFKECPYQIMNRDQLVEVNMT